MQFMTKLPQKYYTVSSIKHPVSSTSAGRKALSMREVQRRMACPVKANRKVTVTQITMHYNSGICRRASLNTQCIKPLSG